MVNQACEGVGRRWFFASVRSMVSGWVRCLWLTAASSECFGFVLATVGYGKFSVLVVVWVLVG